MRLVDESSGPEQQIGVVVDVRSGSFFESLHANLAQGATGRHTTLLFLDANDDVLVRRQEAARRPHPLQGTGRLLDGLQRERAVLADLRSDADLVIDTSNLNVHQLTARIRESFGDPDATRLQINVISFGFKYGIPIDADYVADMRFLPNPHWQPKLRPKSGLRPRRGRLREGPAGRGAVPRPPTCPCSRAWPMGYLAEGKRFMTVAVGCTGGKHRSVVDGPGDLPAAAPTSATTWPPSTATSGGSERDQDACGVTPARVRCRPRRRPRACTRRLSALRRVGRPT